MKAAGKAAPEIQANAVRRIFSIGDKERLTPKEVFDRYEAWGGRKKLESFLQPDQVQAIEDVINVSMAMGQSNRILHGSQTAFLGNIAALAAQAVRNPVQVAKTLATMIPSSYMMGTAKGQKWLTTGLDKATIPGKAARWTGIGSARADAELNASRRRRDIDALMAGEK
jgi:hypothetical protein